MIYSELTTTESHRMTPSLSTAQSIIHMGRAVTLDEVNSWSDEFSSDLTFELTQHSGFSLFAEGMAFAKLREFQEQTIPIRVRTSFPVRISKNGEILGDVGILAQLFGLALLECADSVVDAGGNEVRTSLYEALWSFVQRNSGHFGDGKRRFIAFRDPDYSIPQCLRDEQSGPPFPFPEQFKRVLKNASAALGVGPGLGEGFCEERLIEFLYVTARNSYEHSRNELNQRAINGIRGITIEKFIFVHPEDLSSSRHLPELVRSYVDRIWRYRSRSSRPKPLNLIFAVTVADIGPGIHNTLPPEGDETPWARLNRAFLPRVSRKPASGDVKRGMGLTNVMSAARFMNALLFVRSGALAGYRDFSSGTKPSTGLLFDAWPEPLRGAKGTSLTLIWPIGAHRRFVKPRRPTSFAV